MKLPKSLLDDRPSLLKQEFRLLCASPKQVAREGWRLAELFRMSSVEGEEPDISGLYLSEVLEQLSCQVYSLTEASDLPDDPRPRQDHDFIWEEYDELSPQTAARNPVGFRRTPPVRLPPPRLQRGLMFPVLCRSACLRLWLSCRMSSPVGAPSA